MALIFCPDCGKQFSSEAPACPFCGRPTSTAYPKSADSAAAGFDERSRCLASASTQAGWGLGMGIVSLVLSFISMICAVCDEAEATVIFGIFSMIAYFISGPLATVGLIRTAVNRGGASGKAIAGLVIGIVAVYLTAIVLAVVSEM